MLSTMRPLPRAALKAAEMEAKLAAMDPEKAAKVRAALAAKAARDKQKKEARSMAHRSVIPFGPQHPVLPEPLHLDLVIEDDRVLEAIPQIGFVHRGLEKLTEKRDMHQFGYIAERICGICAVGHSYGYASACERMLGIEVLLPRAVYPHSILHELSRIHSHLLWLGSLADAFGFEALFYRSWTLREQILKIFESTCGGRVILSINEIGGLKHDIEDRC